jgi:tricorn protease
MWIRAFLLASLCGSLLTSSASQATIRFARFPAPSPDGKQVAFSWQGDLWLAPIAGGVAQRLTVHPAYDFAPIWSPDGKKIAFTSDRHGNDDVFVLHLDTGAVQRLTYFSARDRAWGWTPDSRAVLFESRREGEPYGADFGAYVAPLDGGTPYRLHKASGSPFALSPDGKRLAFVRRDSAWWRKGYKGSAQGDLWLLERATNRYVRLTDTDTPDTFPMWGADGRTLYFVSERDGTANLYAMDANTRRIRQLTRFKDDGMRFPQISANGAVITFEQGMDVYRLDTATGAIQSIPLQVPAQDARAAEQVRRTFSANVDDYAIAPDGKEFVFAVRGELFAARFPDGGPSRNLTETVEPEDDPQLSPDGKTLYFAAERDGTVQIYRLTSGDADEPRLRRARTHKIEPLTNAPQGASKPRLSPDGKRLAYQRGLGELVVRCLETQQERTLTESWNLGTIAWSPDSRWIAFDRYDENYNADVFIVRVPEFQTPTPDAEPKEPKPEPAGAGDTMDDTPVVYNLSRHPRNDFAPSWSADGRALVFLSERETDTLNICHVWLRREDYERTRADREEEEDDKHDAPKKPTRKKTPCASRSTSMTFTCACAS